WAIDYEAAATSGATPSPLRPRSDDDLMLLYTGGTTGMPKGVMWRQADLLSLLNSLEWRGLPHRATPAELAAFFPGRRPRPPPAELAAFFAGRPPGRRSVIACPLMHGTGLFFALATLALGGSVITLEAPKFSAGALLDVLAGERANGTVIVGDAFARPLADAL